MINAINSMGIVEREAENLWVSVPSAIFHRALQMVNFSSLHNNGALSRGLLSTFTYYFSFAWRETVRL